MSPRRYFVDTSVLLLAVGGEHRLREPCRAILTGAAEDRLHLHASVEAVQEFLFHRMRRRDPHAVEMARDVASLCTVYDFDRPVLDRMLALVAGGTVGGRDAVHAGTALVHGFTSILTADRDFASVPGLEIVLPETVCL